MCMWGRKGKKPWLPLLPGWKSRTRTLEPGFPLRPTSAIHRLCILGLVSSSLWASFRHVYGAACHSTYLIVLLWGLNERVHVKCLADCRCSVDRIQTPWGLGPLFDWLIGFQHLGLCRAWEWMEGAIVVIICEICSWWVLLAFVSMWVGISVEWPSNLSLLCIWKDCA